jgi:hypothetical protein
MTPTVQAILNDQTQPVKKRRFVDDAGILPDLDNAHCFECSAVYGLAMDMAKRFAATGTSEKLGFLPAPITVLDYRRPGFERTAILLKNEPGGFSAAHLLATPTEFFSAKTSHVPNVMNSYWNKQIRALFQREVLIRDGPSFTLALLAIINTPRIIEQRQHKPHAGLQRRIAASRGMVGKYPLQAWHEVLLTVAPPRLDERTPHETHLTGEKALHFCRTHLRLRLGMLELVASHWRGNPALGIKQTRYRLDRPSIDGVGFHQQAIRSVRP